MKRRGFTLIEVIVVVAIIAVVMTIGVSMLDRGQKKNYVRQGARDLAQRIANARAIAESLGPRIGQNGLIQYLGPAACPNSATNELAVLIDPGTQSYTVPERMEINPATDQMQVWCRTYSINAGPASETRGIGTLVTNGNAPVTLSFTGTGSINMDASTPGVPRGVNHYFEIRNTLTPTEHHGYRILASGIVCRSLFSAAVQCSVDADP